MEIPEGRGARQDAATLAPSPDTHPAQTTLRDTAPPLRRARRARCRRRRRRCRRLVLPSVCLMRVCGVSCVRARSVCTAGIPTPALTRAHACAARRRPAPPGVSSARACPHERVLRRSYEDAGNQWAVPVDLGEEAAPLRATFQAVRARGTGRGRGGGRQRAFLLLSMRLRTVLHASSWSAVINLSNQPHTGKKKEISDLHFFELRKKTDKQLHFFCVSDAISLLAYSFASREATAPQKVG